MVVGLLAGGQRAACWDTGKLSLNESACSRYTTVRCNELAGFPLAQPGAGIDGFQWRPSARRHSAMPQMAPAPRGSLALGLYALWMTERLGHPHQTWVAQASLAGRNTAHWSSVCPSQEASREDLRSAYGSFLTRT